MVAAVIPKSLQLHIDSTNFCGASTTRGILFYAHIARFTKVKHIHGHNLKHANRAKSDVECVLTVEFPLKNYSDL